MFDFFGEMIAGCSAFAGLGDGALFEQCGNGGGPAGFAEASGCEHVSLAGSAGDGGDDVSDCFEGFDVGCWSGCARTRSSDWCVVGRDLGTGGASPARAGGAMSVTPITFVPQSTIAREPCLLDTLPRTVKAGPKLGAYGA